MSYPEPVGFQDKVDHTHFVPIEDWDNIDPIWHFMYRPLYTETVKQTLVYAADGTMNWTPKIEATFSKDGVMTSQTIQYSPQGEKLPFPHPKLLPLMESKIKEIFSKQKEIYLDSGVSFVRAIEKEFGIYG
jgi:hypothetical protein